MKTLAVVPARGGSRGLPGKNARPFLGVSLLERAVRIARETCDEVVVTTDSDELAHQAIRYPGVLVHMRPPELATDEAPMLPVVQDAIRGREGEVIVLLQPTQPLRTAEQVRQALAMLWLPTMVDSVVTVRRVPAHYWPDRLMHVDGGLLTFATPAGGDKTRRQSARPAFVRCGAVYVVRRDVVEEGSLYGPYCRPLVLEGDALSIDTLEDFERLERLAEATLRATHSVPEPSLYMTGIK